MWEFSPFASKDQLGQPSSASDSSDPLAPAGAWPVTEEAGFDPAECLDSIAGSSTTVAPKDTTTVALRATMGAKVNRNVRSYRTGNLFRI